MTHLTITHTHADRTPPTGPTLPAMPLTGRCPTAGSRSNQ